MEQLRWSVGDIKVTCFRETIFPYPAKALFSNAKEADFAPYSKWLRPTFIDQMGSVMLSCHSLLIESGKRRILVDTGFGRRTQELPFKLPWLRMLSKDLEDAGFPVSSIDTVVCTHVHSDHIGGATTIEDGQPVPTFPKATYLISYPEMEYMEADPAHDTGKLMDGYVRPLVSAGVVRRVPMDYQLNEDICLVPTPGHTPGHVSVRITSGRETAILWGDILHSPIEIVEPQIQASADKDPVQSITTRRKMLQECADRGQLVITSHFPAATAGFVRRHDGRYRWEAAK